MLIYAFVPLKWWHACNVLSLSHIGKFDENKHACEKKVLFNGNPYLFLYMYLYLQSIAVFM